MAKTPNIPNGYVMLARVILDSDIWHGPPWCLKLWVWMLLKASHKPGKKLARGQFRTTTQELRKAAEYHVGARPVRPSKWQVARLLRSLREATMIQSARTTRGMIITILHYHRYQTPGNYEPTHEATTKQPRSNFDRTTIDKNGKNDKKDKKKNTTEKVLWNGSEFIIPPAVLKQWEQAYPDIHVGEVIKAVAQWRIDHPEKTYKSERGHLGGCVGRQARKAKQQAEEMPPGHTAPRYPTPEEVDYLTGRTERTEAP